MAAYGYLAYLIRINYPNRPRALQRLSSFGASGTDLLEAIRRQLTVLGSTFYKNDELAEGFRVRQQADRGRSTMVHLRRGPIGSPGETFDVETGESVETGVTTALLGELRAGFYIPRNSYFGFLFVERIGGRHLKDLVYDRILKPIALDAGMAIRVEAFALSKDWQTELGGQQVLRVSEVMHPKSSSEDSSTVDDLKVRVVAEGTGLSSHGEDLKERLFDLIDRRHEEYRKLARVAPLEQRRTIWAETHKRSGEVVTGWKRAPRSSFTVADEAEYDALIAELAELKEGPTAADLAADLRDLLPRVERDQYESQRVEVAFGHDRPEKTFVVTADRVPQLVYELKERLFDTPLRQTWDAVSEQFLRTLGVDLPAAWPLDGKA